MPRYLFRISCPCLVRFAVYPLYIKGPILQTTIKVFDETMIQDISTVPLIVMAGASISQRVQELPHDPTSAKPVITTTLLRSMRPRMAAVREFEAEVSTRRQQIVANVQLQLRESLSSLQTARWIVIGRGMANPQGWRVRIARVRVRVGIWIPLKNSYPWQGFQGYECNIFFSIYTGI